MDQLVNPFWHNKRVLLTGHTGFKGGWAAVWLRLMGAKVTGIALPPDQSPSLFDLIDLDNQIASQFVDLRDQQAVLTAVTAADPEIILHMAAQPLVRRSYAHPVENWQTNIMGTLHVLEAARQAPNLETALIITTDKVYENDESGRAFVETDSLGGYDPYSASKAAKEILVSSYRRSFLQDKGVKLATARGGNVIGGGDFSEDRLVPDIWRAAKQGQALLMRNPTATRPWQHVLDCLSGYFGFIEALSAGATPHRVVNFGPCETDDPVSNQTLASAIMQAMGVQPNWKQDAAPQPHEMELLSISSALARKDLGWKPRLSTSDTITWTANWYRAMNEGADLKQVTEKQICAYMQLKH